MTATFFAQPYDIHATGFYFHDAATYKESIGSIVNAFGQVVEEFEIQFIDGTDLDCKLAQAIEPNQCNILAMMKAMETWSDEQKVRVALAVGECGYSFDLDCDDPDDLDIDIYADVTLSDLAHQFVDEGLFGDIPDRLAFYLDYDAIARDLGIDYGETTIGGDQFVYRAA